MQSPPESPQQQQYAAYPRYQRRRGPGTGRVRFEALNEAWSLMKKDWGTFVVASLVTLILSAGVEGAFGAVQAGFAGPSGTMLAFAVGLDIVSIVVGQAVLTIALGGITKIALLKASGHTAAIGDMFSLGGSFGQLAIFGVITSVPWILFMLVTGGAVLYQSTAGASPEAVLIPYAIAAVAGLLIAACVTVFLILGPALIVDQQMSAWEAAVTSAKTVGPRYFSFVGLAIVGGIWSGLGVLLCCVGILFTYPILQVTLAIVYRDLFLHQGELATSPAPVYGIEPPTFDA